MHAPAAAGGLLALAIAAVPGAAGHAAAATPEPVDPFPAIQTWIDAPIQAPLDAPAGSRVVVGVTLWDERADEPWSVDGLRVKLHPATGNAAPSVARAMPDAPGHVVADLVTPEGGPGRIEIVTRGQACTSDGTCSDVDVPLRIDGTGPPPDVPRSALVRAELLPIRGDVVAGRPFALAVVVSPIGMWDMEALDLPDALVVGASGPTGKRLAFAQLRQAQAGPFQPYEGRLEIPERGVADLTAAFVAADGLEQAIGGPLGSVMVTGPPGRPDASAAPRATSADDAVAPSPVPDATDTGAPLPILVAAAVLVLGLALFLGEPIRRRLRPGPDER